MDRLKKELDHFTELRLVFPNSFHDLMVNAENNLKGLWLFYTIFYYYCCFLALAFTPNFLNVIVFPFAIPITLYLLPSKLIEVKNNLFVIGVCMSTLMMFLSGVHGCLETYFITTFISTELIFGHSMFFKDNKGRHKKKERDNIRLIPKTTPQERRVYQQTTDTIPIWEMNRIW